MPVHDRVLALAPLHGQGSRRRAVQAAHERRSRDAVVVELTREADRMQTEDRARLERFRAASQPFRREFQAAGITAMHLPEAHQRVVELAERALPLDPFARGGPEHGAAQ